MKRQIVVSKPDDYVEAPTFEFDFEKLKKEAEEVKRPTIHKQRLQLIVTEDEIAGHHMKLSCDLNRLFWNAMASINSRYSPVKETGRHSVRLAGLPTYIHKDFSRPTKVEISTGRDAFIIPIKTSKTNLVAFEYESLPYSFSTAVLGMKESGLEPLLEPRRKKYKDRCYAEGAQAPSHVLLYLIWCKLQRIKVPISIVQWDLQEHKNSITSDEYRDVLEVCKENFLITDNSSIANGKFY